MLTIAWDIDDVLNELMKDWLNKKWRPEHSDCNLLYEDITINPPQDLLKTTLTQYSESLDAFRLSPQYINMQPNKEILKWFKKHGHKARHLVLTAVPKSCAHISAEWIIKNFGDWIRNFHFVPSYRNGFDIPEYDKSKPDFLEWFGKAGVFIDDTVSNIKGIEDLGVRSFIVNRPWNTSNLDIKEILENLTDMVNKND